MAGGSRSFLSASYRVSIALILVFGALAAAFSYRDTRRTEDERIEAEFRRRSALRHAMIREVLGRYSESLFGLSDLFTLDTEISPADFRRVVHRIDQQLPGALAFEWVPIVTADQRSEFEAKMRRLTRAAGLGIVAFDADGHPQRDSDRPYYFPILYIEPLRGNEVALGYDLTSGPTRSYLERARTTGEMTITSQFRLVQERTEKLAIVMIWPVFRDGAAKNNTTNGPCLGFLQCVFHVDELLETAASLRPPSSAVNMLFVDGSESAPERRVLYYHPATGPLAGQKAPTEAEFRRDAPFVTEYPLPLGGRDWRILYRPERSWIAGERTLGPWARAGSILVLSGLLAGLVAVIGRRTDTIRQEVEERTAELAESRRQLASLLQALPGVAFRGRYVDQLEIQFASEGAQALFGRPASDFMAQTVFVRDFIHPEDLPRVRSETRAALKARRDFEIEYRVRTESGEEKWVLSRGRGVYGPDGALQFVEGLAIDITRGKRAEADRLVIERKLLEAQKLESLGLLAGGIAHDFNNLLSAVLGNANLARMSLPTGNPADAQIRAIETAALRAAELCRQMLAYAGKGRFVVEHVNISALVEDILPLLRVSIARSATLHLELNHQIPGVKADATQVRQIVMNLVLNAVDALAGRDGEITIRTGVRAVDRALLAQCVTGTGLPLGDYVFLEVIDTGSGMPPEVKNKIFDPFFTTKFSGRGLGLAAVLGIVRGHNGALQVESEVDHGSTFRLLLPPAAGEGSAVPAAPAEPAQPWRRTGNVLVIEDEEPIRAVMVQLLNTYGFEAHGAASGRAGVSVFRENASRWDLVIIDLLMPGMSGEETLGALRAIKQDVRVLLMSGYAEGDVLTRVKGGGRVAFIAKPFKQDVFEQKLRDLLD